MVINIAKTYAEKGCSRFVKVMFIYCSCDRNRGYQAKRSKEAPALVKRAWLGTGRPVSYTHLTLPTNREV